MDYPREIKLSSDREQALISYLNEELIAHKSERTSWVADLTAWQDDYWATPENKEKTFPFKGAANIIIPLTAISVESVHAREMTTLSALNQYVSCKIYDPQLQDITYDVEKAIDWELKNGCDFYKFADTALLENKKLGTCIGKVGYEKIVKTAIKQDGDREVEFQVITKQGPTIQCVPLANFMMPFTATDPQESPWVGEEHLANPFQIKQLVDSGFFRPDVINNLQNYFASSLQQSSASYLQEMRKQQDQTPIQWPREISWDEVQLEFDVDGSNQKKEIIVHYHRPSQSFFSIRYNYNSDLHRDYRIGNYFPIEHRWAGIGIAKQTEQFQHEITAQHRQRIDNATLANMRMFKVKAGIGIGPDEPLFPGKMFFLDEMEDIDSLQVAEIYPSSYNNEQQAVIYAQQRNGSNELSMGMPQVGTPGTATSDMQRVQEFNRKFDYTFGNSKIFLKQIVIDVLAVQSQYGFRDPRYFTLIGDNGQKVQQFLAQDADLFRKQLLMELNVVQQSANRALDRSNWTQYAQMLQQYWMGAMQLAQMIQNPQLMQMLGLKALQSITEAMKQIGEGFDIRSPDRVLIPDAIIQQLLGPLANGLPLIGAGGQPAQGSQGIVPQPGMGGAPPVNGQPSQPQNQATGGS